MTSDKKNQKLIDAMMENIFKNIPKSLKDDVARDIAIYGRVRAETQDRYKKAIDAAFASVQGDKPNE